MRQGDQGLRLQRLGEQPSVVTLQAENEEQDEEGR